MLTPGSPDISSLSVLVTWNISQSVPEINLVNESVGANLANVSYAFLVKSPSQTIIHDGNIATPDITGIWTEDTLDDPWPRPWNQIEWSGADYTIQIFAKDSVGNIYQYTIGQPICRPVGNVSASVTTYGKGVVSINLNCVNASAFFEDISNTSYKGLSGTETDSQLKVIYPDDETDTAPEPFIINPFSTAVVPVTYDSQNYEFVYFSIYNYEFPGGSFVKIKYYTKQRFSVLCNIDLCPLVCEYTKLLDKFERGDCQDMAETQRKIITINGKLQLCMIGKSQPMCGIDVPTLIEEIKVIGGFECDCCAPSGITPFNSASLGDYNFSIVTGGGDISGYPTVTGNNIQFTLFDKSYVFRMSPDVPTAAFTVVPTTAGYTKTYSLNVSLTILAADLATTIEANPDLVNAWSFLGGGAPTFIVDGKCIFESVPACDYTFTLAHIPIDSSYAILTSLTVNGVVLTPNFAFNEGNLAALQTYLNSLNAGTWTVSDPVSGTILIESENNGNTVSGINYAVSSTNYTASLNKVCGGYVPVTGNYAVQKIIDYLCTLDDTKIVTSEDYVICYIDPADNSRKTVTVASGEELVTFFTALLTAGCQTIQYVSSLSKLSCANIQALFPTTPSVLQATDYLLASKSSECARVFPTELFLAQLQLGAYNADVIAAFCAMVSLCAVGGVCQPYDVFNVEVETFDPACPAILDFGYTVDGTDLTITTISFANTPSTTQTITIEYKLSSDTSYTLYSSTVVVGTDGTVITTVHIIVVEGLTYNVRISDNCNSPADGIVKTITIPGETPFANIVFGWTSALDMTVTSADIEGDIPTLISGTGFPFNTDTHEYNTTNTGTLQTVNIYINSGVAGQKVRIVDSNGVEQCNGISSGAITTTFLNVAIDNVTPVNIFGEDGPCS